jgi:hypothetical protein
MVGRGKGELLGGRMGRGRNQHRHRDEYQPEVFHHHESDRRRAIQPPDTVARRATSAPEQTPAQRKRADTDRLEFAGAMGFTGVATATAVTPIIPGQTQRGQRFDRSPAGPYNQDSSAASDLVSQRSPYGGDTVSTGVKTRGMHAELH